MVVSAHADIALVIGVGGYPNLGPDNQLEGTVGDMSMIAKDLKAYGFKVIELPDAKATRKGILDAIARIKKEIKPTERFVFYFAGHGQASPNPAILPYDADPGEGEVRILRDDLNTIVQSVPAESRTIILDSCYSGGLAKALVRFKTRSYSGVVSKSLSHRPPPPLPQAKGICYVTAANKDEPAIELQTDAGAHGLFTYYLNEEIQKENASKDKRSWSDVMQAVQMRIQEKLDSFNKEHSSNYAQHPAVSPKFQALPLFAGDGTPPPKPLSQDTLLKIYTAKFDDPDKLDMALNGKSFTVSTGEFFHVQGAVKQDGYLVILGEEKNRYYRVFPDADHHDPYPIKKGQFVQTGMIFSDTVGHEIAKVFVFSDRGMALGVMNGTAVPDLSQSDLKKGLGVAADATAPFVTQTIGIDVDNQLVGGLQVTKPAAGWQALMGLDDTGTYLRGQLKDNGADPKQVEGALGDKSLRTDDRLALWLNILLQDGSLGGAVFVNPPNAIDPNDTANIIPRNAKLMLAKFGAFLKKGAN